MIAPAGHPVVARLAPATYIAAIAGCEIVTAAAGVTAGAVCDALVCLWLVNEQVFRGGGAGDSGMLMGLALVPLLALFGAAIPLTGISPVVRDGCVACLLLGAIWLAAEVVPLRLDPLRLPRRDLSRQLRVAAAGVPLGLVGYAILQPRPLVAPGDPWAVVGAVLVLGGLAAPSVELLFRWVLQGQLVALYGDAGLVVVNVLFAGLYLIIGSAGFVALMALTGLGLSLAVRRSGTVWGAAAAHGLLTAGCLVVWPAVL